MPEATRNKGRFVSTHSRCCRFVILEHPPPPPPYPTPPPPLLCLSVYICIFVYLVWVAKRNKGSFVSAYRRCCRFALLEPTGLLSPFSVFLCVSVYICIVVYLVWVSFLLLEAKRNMGSFVSTYSRCCRFSILELPPPPPHPIPLLCLSVCIRVYLYLCVSSLGGLSIAGSQEKQGEFCFGLQSLL